MIGDDVGGIAVYIGARVAALARASEVLVSSTVKDLVAPARACVSATAAASPSRACPANGTYLSSKGEEPDAAQSTKFVTLQSPPEGRFGSKSEVGRTQRYGT